MMTVVAPAKLNLTLEVLKKCDDGFHEIRSIVQTINFCDTLNFSSQNVLEFKCNLPNWSPDQSLVSKTSELVSSITGSKQGALIDIKKRIPLSSGLGGDSSDAAAVLRGLNMLWGLKLSLRELLKIAGQLGSDVPLFLHGGTLLMEGRGEILTPVHPMPHMPTVLLIPAIPQIEGKTGKMYSRLLPRDYTKGEVTQNFLNILDSSDKNPISGLFNIFDRAAIRFFAGLKSYKEAFIEAGADEVHVAGSGPALFTLVENETVANNIYSRLKEKGMEAYLADF